MPISNSKVGEFLGVDANSVGTVSAGTDGASATSIATKLGTTLANVSVNAAAKLLSLRTGIGTGSEVEKLSVTAGGLLTATSANLSSTSGTTLTVYGADAALPVFTVQGSSGELFSIKDSLTGSLFSVNDISGLPILEVFSDNTILQGSYAAPSLNTTIKTVLSATGAFTVYSVPTASYDGLFIEYVAKNGTNARAGQIMAVWSGTSVNFTETTTTDFGDTSGLTFSVTVSGSNMVFGGSATASGWTIKTIVRAI